MNNQNMSNSNAYKQLHICLNGKTYSFFTDLLAIEDYTYSEEYENSNEFRDYSYCKEENAENGSKLLNDFLESNYDFENNSQTKHLSFIEVLEDIRTKLGIEKYDELLSLEPNMYFVFSNTWNEFIEMNEYDRLEREPEECDVDMAIKALVLSAKK